MNAVRRSVAALSAGAVVAVSLSLSPSSAADDPYSGATFTISHESPDPAPVPSHASVLLTATDAEGAPLPDLLVRFERSGPGDEATESCPATLDGCAVTDAQGVATYDYVAAASGHASVIAHIHSPQGRWLADAGPDTASFVDFVCRPHGRGGSSTGTRTSCIDTKLSGRSVQNRDVLKVNGPSIYAGAQVRLQRKRDGDWRRVGQVRRLDGSGNRAFRVRDRNGRLPTRYRAVVAASEEIRGDTSNMVRLP